MQRSGVRPSSAPLFAHSVVAPWRVRFHVRPHPHDCVGYDKLKADLDQLHTVEVPKILERLGKARAEGDLNENAEYHGAQESGP